MLIGIPGRIETLKMNDKQKAFILSFFESQRKYIHGKLFVDAEEIQHLADLYQTYLESSEFKNDSLLQLFLLDLKEAKIWAESNANSSSIYVARLTRPPHCCCTTIKTWYNSARVVRTLTRADMASINRSIEPKIQQNKQERIASSLAAKDVVVRSAD